MAKNIKEGQIQVRVRHNSNSHEVFTFNLNGKKETVLPDEKMTVNEKDLGYLNALDGAWKFNPIEDTKGVK
ncbi:hypothetical protein [Tetragenococcus halophilus]|uniref:hypothetical protein n=1 Tax=Tetragenococcus halophilus TaxID=51669 RepID=UPI002AA07533|nr:hypothetical protein TEHSL10_19110 [Tetragenococcus halophilus]